MMGVYHTLPCRDCPIFGSGQFKFTLIEHLSFALPDEIFEVCLHTGASVDVLLDRHRQARKHSRRKSGFRFDLAEGARLL